MAGNTSPDLSELAYHIVSLWTFWNRSHSQKGEAIKAIKPMIEFYFGADGADPIAHMVVAALETIENVNPYDDARAKEDKINSVCALLQLQTVDLVESRTTKYWATVFYPAVCADSIHA